MGRSGGDCGRKIGQIRRRRCAMDLCRVVAGIPRTTLQEYSALDRPLNCLLSSPPHPQAPLPPRPGPPLLGRQADRPPLLRPHRRRPCQAERRGAQGRRAQDGPADADRADAPGGLHPDPDAGLGRGGRRGGGGVGGDGDGGRRVHHGGHLGHAAGQAQGQGEKGSLGSLFPVPCTVYGFSGERGFASLCPGEDKEDKEQGEETMSIPSPFPPPSR